MDILTATEPYEVAIHALENMKKVPKILEELEKISMEELGIDKGQYAMDKNEYDSYCSLTLYDVKRIIKKLED